MAATEDELFCIIAEDEDEEDEELLEDEERTIISEEDDELLPAPGAAARWQAVSARTSVRDARTETDVFMGEEGKSKQEGHPKPACAEEQGLWEPIMPFFSP